MKRHRFFVLAGFLFIFLPGRAAAQDVLAGWFGVFPELPGYQRTFQSPMIAADKKSYRQAVRYEGTGGRIEQIEVILTRDPALKDRFTAEALKKEERPPKEVKVGAKSAWLWLGADGSPRRLVVPLADDKMLELLGSGMIADLLKPADAWDLPRATAALDMPPRIDFARKVEAFQALPKNATLADVTGWVGAADQKEKDGDGKPVLIFKLPDATLVRLGFDAELKKLGYAHHEIKDGKIVELLK
jgi:hypothetical protein